MSRCVSDQDMVPLNKATGLRQYQGVSLRKKGGSEEPPNTMRMPQPSFSTLSKALCDEATHSVKMLCDIGQRVIPGFLPYSVFNMDGGNG